jgi:hypothetical protein
MRKATDNLEWTMNAFSVTRKAADDLEWAHSVMRKDLEWAHSQSQEKLPMTLNGPILSHEKSYR